MYRKISGLWKEEREEIRGRFCALKRRRTPCVPAAPRGRCKCSTLNGIYRPVLHTRFANKLIHYKRSLAFSFIRRFHGWENASSLIERQIVFREFLRLFFSTPSMDDDLTIESRSQRNWRIVGSRRKCFFLQIESKICAGFFHFWNWRITKNLREYFYTIKMVLLLLISCSCYSTYLLISSIVIFHQT